jgi:hypothetical protein
MAKLYRVKVRAMAETTVVVRAESITDAQNAAHVLAPSRPWIVRAGPRDIVSIDYDEVQEVLSEVECDEAQAR